MEQKIERGKDLVITTGPPHHHHLEQHTVRGGVRWEEAGSLSRVGILVTIGVKLFTLTMPYGSSVASYFFLSQ